MQQRNNKINAVVELSSFGNISYLINKFPELVDDCIYLDNKYKKNISVELLLGWTSLTQREYNSVKEIPSN